jgi:hypothetical protein
MSMPAAARFTLDVGASPQPGQTWEVNQDLEINGNRLQVLSAEYIQAGPGEPAMLMLYLASDSGILTIIAMDTEHEILGTGGSPGSAQVPFRAGWYYKDGFPTGIVTVDITTITLRRPGPWSIAWTPPAAAAAPTVTAPARLPQSGSQSGSGSGLCPDAAPVPAAFQDLPAGLAGRVAFSEGENHDLFAANLDGSRRIPLGPGLFPDLSLDGRRVVYRGLEGELHVRDLAGGEDRLIPETGQEGIIDLRPRWSPDGQQIAFDRVTGHASDIYRVSSDGSNLQALLNGPEDESFLGWAADGRRLFYRVSVAEGQSIRLLDLDTGRSMETALLPFEAAQVSLSPDGQRIAYIDDLGISLVPLGEAPVFLLSNPLEFGNPLWSPDGRWIALTYWPSQDYGERRLALLQPDTCQLLQLDQQMGDWLSSWVP